jgi:uncharacterized protein YlxW (UPF0749 family)
MINSSQEDKNAEIERLNNRVSHYERLFNEEVDKNKALKEELNQNRIN